MPRKTMKGLLGAVLALLGPGTGLAQDTYPSKPIRMIVNGAAGGVTDVPARLVAEHMREVLGQTIVIDGGATISGG